MLKDAVISPCEKYRYMLTRTWAANLPSVLFVMLNPSTADAEIDDPTISSCVRLAKSWNYGEINVVNLFAWRATDPKELRDVADPVGPDNDVWIRIGLSSNDLYVCAWGANKMASKNDRDRVVLDEVNFYGTPSCLGVTKLGAPKHPLYIKTGTELQGYELL